MKEKLWKGWCAIRTMIFLIAFTIHNILIIAIGMLLYPFSKNSVATAQIWVSNHSVPWLQKYILGITVRYKGLEHKSTEPCILACKHESSMDTIGLLNIIYPRISYLLKKELLSVPFAKPLFEALKYIPVDRKNATSSLRTIITLSKEYIEQGQYICIFPEGTRMPPNSPTLFKGGITKIYKDVGKPIQPIALNTGVLWDKRRFTIYPGVVTVEILPLIPAGLDPRQMLDRLEREIGTHSLALAKEGCPPFLKEYLGF